MINRSINLTIDYFSNRSINYLIDLILAALVECTHYLLILFDQCFGVLNNLRRVVDIMADEEGIVDIEDEKPEDQTVKKAAKHDSVRATDLEKVTDYVEEAEISSNNISDVRHCSVVLIAYRSDY